uniref:Slingshot N-terminal domain-containing protein n=1 Tax=Parascaris equorum TaxID=6256 RepID=A0A914S1S3_PAREQ
MLRMLPPEDTLTMAVRLQPNSDQDCSQDHARYLAVVASSSRQDIDDSRDARECVLLGLDCLPGDKATFVFYCYEPQLEYLIAGYLEKVSVECAVHLATMT